MNDLYLCHNSSDDSRVEFKKMNSTFGKPLHWICITKQQRLNLNLFLIALNEASVCDGVGQMEDSSALLRELLFCGFFRWDLESLYSFFPDYSPVLYPLFGTCLLCIYFIKCISESCVSKSSGRCL